MNNLFQQLNQNQQRMSLPNNVRQMINNFKALQNPQAYLQQQLNSNPQFKSLIQASNGNYEKAFRDMAQQMNVDHNEIINMFKS